MARFLIVAPSGPSTAGQGRYEYRCWPGADTSVLGAVQDGWPLETCEIRTDVHLVGAAGAGSNVKLRGGTRLEVKVMEGRCGPLEYWRMPLSVPFPLDRQALRVLRARLGGLGPIDDDARTSPAALISAIAGAGRPVRAVSLRKARLLFRRGSCRVEITSARIDGHRRLTVGLEDPDPRSAMTAAHDLGLGRYPNRDYASVLGMGALPQPTPTDRPLHSRGAFS